MSVEPDADARARLARHPLLAGRADLRAAARLARFEPGATVIHEGELGADLFVVLSGTARVDARAEGGPARLALLGPGEVFGEEALLSGARRSATVTAAAPLVCARIEADTLRACLEADAKLRRALEDLSARRLHERLARSASALAGLELAGTEHADVSRVLFAPGETIVAQGARSDAVYFLLEGSARARRDGGDALARLGPGQCVGELGVLERKPRVATVVAETGVAALRVAADRFRAWVAENPRLADLLGTLERIYPLADGRQLSVFKSRHEGREAITTLAGDPAGDCVLSTKVVGEDLLVLVRGAGGPRAGEVPVRHADPASGRERELMLGDVERGARGEVVRARVRGVRVRGGGPDVPRLYQLLRSGERLTRRELARFRRSGYLGGATAVADLDSVCPCLGIGARELGAAAAEHGADADALRAALGLGAVCGACLPRLPERLAASRGGGAPAGAARATATSGLVARLPEITFDEAVLQELATHPLTQVVAVASVFATVGERFMIERVGAATPALRDPELEADATVFLQQEGLHVTAHAPLNLLLLERVYPRSRALRRLARGMVGGVHRLPPRVALGVCAAFEHAADGAFAQFLERYYRDGRTFSPDPALHALVERSGLGALMLWHGAEELAHRHVAFEVLRECDGRWRHRAAGLAVLALQAVALLLPALASLRWRSRGRARPWGRAAERAGGVAVVLRTGLHGLRMLLPGFHPRRLQLACEDELARDLERVAET